MQIKIAKEGFRVTFSSSFLVLGVTASFLSLHSFPFISSSSSLRPCLFRSCLLLGESNERPVGGFGMGRVCGALAKCMHLISLDLQCKNEELDACMNG
jgi:hypothetical protein